MVIGALARARCRAAPRPRWRVETPGGAADLRRAARARRAARRALARGARPATAWRSRCRPASTSSVALHACLLAGARRDAGRPAARRARAQELLRGAELVVDRRCRATAARRRRRRAARGRGRARRPHLGHHRRAAAGRADFGNIAGQRARLGGRARHWTPDERWLCPLPLSHVGGLMVLLRSRDLRDHRRARAFGRARRTLRRRHARLARADAARAPARRRRPPPARGCARSCSAAARRRPRCSRAPRPTPACRSRRPTGSPGVLARSRSPSRATPRPPAAPLPGIEV